MKNKLLLVLMLIAAVVVMPRVYAEEALDIKIEDNTQSDTLKTGTAKVDTEGDVTTITYDDATFKLLDGTGGRTENKAWIGFKITLPTEGISKYDLKNVTLDRDVVKAGEVHDDNDKVVNVYVNFDEATLKEAAASAKNIEYTFTLTITPNKATKAVSESEEETITKTIKVVVVPKGIVLQEKDSDNQVWNEEKYEEARPSKVTVKVMKDGEEVELEKPLSYDLVDTKTLTEEQVAAIKAALTDENLELVGLYTDADQKNVFDAAKDIDEDTTVYVVYKTKEKASVVEEPAPNTIDNAIIYFALAGVSLLVAGGVALYFKKNNE